MLGIQVVALLVGAILARAGRRVTALTLLALICVLTAQWFFWTFAYPAKCRDVELDDRAPAMGIFERRRRNLAVCGLLPFAFSDLLRSRRHTVRSCYYGN